MDPELVKEAQAAIAAGADPVAVAAQFKQLSGMDLPVQAGDARDAIKSDAASRAAQSRLSAGGGSALGDFLRMAGNSGTLGFSDELRGLGAAVVPGGKDYLGARDEERQKLADLNLLAPTSAKVAAGLAGAVPQMLIPLGAGARAVSRGKGLLGIAARGGALGGVQGGLLGIGSQDSAGLATPGEMGRSAALPAAIGAGVGAVTAVAPAIINAAVKKFGSPGARVGKELVDETGLRTDYEKMVEEATAAKRAVSKNLFGPIDARGKITNAKITEVLEQIQAPAPAKARTLTEFRKLAEQLDRTNPAGAAELRTVMAEQIEGLAEANAAYGPAVRPYEALDTGRSGFKTAADIRTAMKGMTPKESFNFRSARLHDILAKLNARDEDSVGLLKAFVDAGDETKQQIRTLFDDEAAYKRFLTVLGRERSAEKVWSALPKAAAVGAVGGSGIWGYLRLRGGP